MRVQSFCLDLDSATVLRLTSRIVEQCRIDGQPLTDVQIKVVRTWVEIIRELPDEIITDRDATIAQLKKENHSLRVWLSGELVIFNSEIDDRLAKMEAEREAG